MTAITSKKITVPGTTGNIGTALIHHLLKQSPQVTAVARPSARLDAQAQAGTTPKAGDAHDAPFLTEALRGAGLSENMADLYDEMTRNINDGKSIANTPRDAASTTPTTVGEFAQAVFAPAFEAATAGA